MMPLFLVINTFLKLILAEETPAFLFNVLINERKQCF